MNDLAIHVKNVGKQYKIGGLQKQNQTIREYLTEVLQSPFRRMSSVIRGQASTVSSETLWALKDISFDVPRGEVVGIVGHNGAGKSTLLKILSRITEPTEGDIQIKGRVGSLLEVGTGFHPELTGRENVFLNGAILGMRRAEIERKFDEIIAFSGVEKFLDTPVKHYSSGMSVRLAFAVAAHLEPEILLIDEVLAVGDVAFQRKCLGKMQDVSKEGRTVLFVSHNMAAVLSLCSSGILLRDGNVYYMGTASDVVHQYLTTVDKWAETSLKDRTDRKGSGLVQVVECKICREPSAENETDFMLGEEAYIVLKVEAKQSAQVFIGVQIMDLWGRLIFAFNSREGNFAPMVQQGLSDITLHIPWLPFLEGKYIMDATIHEASSRQPYDKIEKVGSFVMHPTDIYNSSKPFTSQHGVVFINHNWIGEVQNNKD